jgi:hypothetical protein
MLLYLINISVVLSIESHFLLLFCHSNNYFHSRNTKNIILIEKLIKYLIARIYVYIFICFIMFYQFWIHLLGSFYLRNDNQNKNNIDQINNQDKTQNITLKTNI